MSYFMHPELKTLIRTTLGLPDQGGALQGYPDLVTRTHYTEETDSSGGMHPVPHVSEFYGRIMGVGLRSEAVVIGAEVTQLTREQMAVPWGTAVAFGDELAVGGLIYSVKAIRGQAGWDWEQLIDLEGVKPPGTALAGAEAPEGDSNASARGDRGGVRLSRGEHGDGGGARGRDGRSVQRARR